MTWWFCNWCFNVISKYIGVNLSTRTTIRGYFTDLLKDYCFRSIEFNLRLVLSRGRVVVVFFVSEKKTERTMLNQNSYLGFGRKYRLYPLIKRTNVCCFVMKSFFYLFNRLLLNIYFHRHKLTISNNKEKCNFWTVWRP